MSHIDLKELSPKNQDQRARRLRRIKSSVAGNRYEVNANLIALDMMREAFTDASSRRSAG